MLLASACSTTADGCDDPVTEDFDPQSVVHVGAGVEVRYLTDPPTSGPHAPGPPPDVIPTAPIDGPVQVGWLEAGAVIIQYRELEAPHIDVLEARFGDGVVVAPNPDLPDPIVVTAFVTKMRCRSVDVEPIDAFIEEHLDVSDATPDHVG